MARKRAAAAATAADPNPVNGVNGADGGSVASAAPMSTVAPPRVNTWPKRVRVGLFDLCVCAPVVAMFALMELDWNERRSIAINAAMSLAGFFVTTRVIPMAVPYMLRRNMFGFDINKKGSPAGEVKIPESQGLVVALVYLVVIILFQHFYFTPDSPWLVEYNAALACICFMAFLGFIDDVLDIPWRVKLILPSFAALPLLMAYSGPTTVVIPKPLRWLTAGAVPPICDLGFLYKAYMGLLVVFCSNSINILAGVNGVEAGQTAIIAASVLMFNIWQIGEFPGLKLPLLPDQQQPHLFSIYLLTPLLAGTLGLMTFNWYPSQVFVGDTFTYFAGMTLAVVGILGHFSETLLLLFLPQIINFIYSTPQLFKFVPCPRHRLPKFDPSTGLLTGSNDLNLVNLFLRVFGRCNEETLCIRLLMFQALASVLCFTARLLLQGVYK